MKKRTLTFYGKYAFRPEGASMTRCVKGLQLLKKQIKSNFKLLLKNDTEYQKY